MSSINGISNGNVIHTVVNQPVQRTVSAEPTGHTRATDKLELSGAGHLLKALKSEGGVRLDKVASVKAQIAAGAYDDDHKLNVAVDRLLDDLNL